MKNYVIIGLISFLMTYSWNADAQAILKGGSADNEVSQNLEEGATVLDANLGFIKSIDLEQGDILVLFERYTNAKISGRYKLITSSEPELAIGFKCMYAILFNNDNDEVMGFEDPNFSGKAMTFQKGKNAVPEGFGLSSIYIPKTQNVKLYTIDPDLYPNQEVEHRPMGPGIRPFIGVDINDKVKFVLVE
ncbi:MAG TPA: hypothetical protein VLZ75_08505 [Chitinophagales bacterium]|nr:hypothetical protein [Chitinophagales bacterium]